MPSEWAQAVWEHACYWNGCKIFGLEARLHVWDSWWVIQKNQEKKLAIKQKMLRIFGLETWHVSTWKIVDESSNKSSKITKAWIIFTDSANFSLLILIFQGYVAWSGFFLTDQKRHLDALWRPVVFPSKHQQSHFQRGNEWVHLPLVTTRNGKSASDQTPSRPPSPLSHLS